MLREARGGLVRTSPSGSGGPRDREQHHDEQEHGPQSEHGRGPARLIEELIEEHGCVITTALVGPGIKPVRSKDAQRKQKKRAQLKGIERQITLSAPDNPMAREFLMMAAKAIKSKPVLKALRSALDDPSLVRIGQKVLKLRGEAGAEVRRALGL
jgi:hypothetical protein